MRKLFATSVKITRSATGKRFRRGNGELLGFSIVAVMICTLVMILFGLIQLSTCVSQISQALSVTGRAAAISTDMEEAKQKAQMVAETAIMSSNIKRIKAKVEYATDQNTWQSGTYIKVTVSGKVNTMDPYFTSKVYKKSGLFVVEGVKQIGQWSFSPDEMNDLYAYVQQGDSDSYEGALAVITCACNRAEENYRNYGEDPLSQIKELIAEQHDATDTFEQYRNGNVTDRVREAVGAALAGTRTHDYLSFRRQNNPTGTWDKIGSNYYF